MPPETLVPSTELPRLLIAVPCLNEAETVGRVIDGIPRNLPGVSQVDVLIVDDGSSDSTSEVALHRGAVVLRHTHNRGLGYAFYSAVNFAVEHGYTMMVNIDGDDQFSPADISRLVVPILAGEVDVVTASRFKDPTLIPDMPRVKLLGNKMMSHLISNLVGHHYDDVSCGFRCYSREALLQLNLHGAFTYTQESFLDLSAKNLRIVEVPVTVRYFSNRRSRVAGRLIRYFVQTALIIFRAYRDYYPLKFFSYISLGFTVPAAIMSGIFFLHFVVTGKFSGYLFLGFTSAFFFFIAAAFLVLGIVADMLDRIRANQDRILYFLKKQGRTIARH